MKVERLEHKLGIKASDTAVISFTDCRVRLKTCSVTLKLMLQKVLPV